MFNDTLLIAKRLNGNKVKYRLRVYITLVRTFVLALFAAVRSRWLVGRVVPRVRTHAAVCTVNVLCCAELLRKRATATASEARRRARLGRSDRVSSDGADQDLCVVRVSCKSIARGVACRC